VRVLADDTIVKLSEKRLPNSMTAHGVERILFMEPKLVPHLSLQMNERRGAVCYA